MRRGTLTLLFIIILLAAGASFVVFWPHTTSGKPLYNVNNPFTFVEGLDLQGGVRIQLQPRGNPTQDELATTRTLLEQRVNSGLGVKEPSVRIQNGVTSSIVVELPNFSGNQQDAVDTLLKTGDLAFWDTGTQGLQDNSAFDPKQFTQYNPGGKPLFTGNDLDPSGLSVGQDTTTGAYLINFVMKGDAAARFGQYTASNVGHYLTVTLDKKVVTSPQIKVRSRQMDRLQANSPSRPRHRQ